jgi:hypothetical protein
VTTLLAEAEDIGAILEVLPELMEPRNVMSVLVTVRKWYHNKKDPVQVGTGPGTHAVVLPKAASMLRARSRWGVAVAG